MFKWSNMLSYPSQHLLLLRFRIPLWTDHTVAYFFIVKDLLVLIFMRTPGLKFIYCKNSKNHKNLKAKLKNIPAIDYDLGSNIDKIA